MEIYLSQLFFTFDFQHFSSDGFVMSRRIPEEGSLSRIAGLSPEQRRLDWRVKRQIEKLDAVPTRMSKMLGWAGWGSAICESDYLSTLAYPGHWNTVPV